jgi:RNA polymerase sigma-70 factor (ECF subfamily)
MVYGVALKYLEQPEEAQDAVIQLFEELIESLKIHQVGEFKPWLYTCIRDNCLIALRRKQGDLSILLDESFVDICFDLDCKDGEEIRKKALQECINTLPEKQRICMNSFFFDGLSYQEVTTRTGFSLKNVKSFIQNGKRNLKSCLERKGFFVHETEP